MCDNFKVLLAQHGLTRYKISKATGVSQGSLSDWVNGKSIPKYESLKKIANYLGVTVECLRDEVEIPRDDVGFGDVDGMPMDEMLKRIVECIGPRHGAKKELAEYLDIHPNVITNWLNGRNKSYRKYLPQIAAYYNKSLDYFLGNESESHSDTSTTPKRKLRSISRLEDCEITPEQDEEISNYIDYLLSKRGK